MTRILLAAVFLTVLLAGAALTPKPSEATGTHAILTVDRAVTGGRGYRAGSGTADSLSPSSWTLNTDTGTVTATVTDFYWSSTTIYFTIDQCLFEDGKDLTGLMIGAIPNSRCARRIARTVTPIRCPTTIPSIHPPTYGTYRRFLRAIN